MINRKVILGTTLLTFLTIASVVLTAMSISAQAASIQGWQEWIYDNMWVGPYDYEYEYHYNLDALSGDADDTGVWPPGSDYSFSAKWQSAYYRIRCKGTNYEDIGINIEYKYRFYIQ